MTSVATDQNPTEPAATAPEHETTPVTPHQSAAAPVLDVDTGYTAAGVPTLEGVREKIETRYGTALGATELAEETPEGRTAAEQFQARQEAAARKLEEIRASMRKPGEQ